MQHIVRAFKILPSWRKKLLYIAALGLTMAIVNISVPLAIQRIIDTLFRSINQKQDISAGLAIPFVLWISLKLVASIAEWLKEIVADDTFREVAIRFRLYCVTKLEMLPIAYFEKRRAGQITSEVNQSPFQFADWLVAMIEDKSIDFLSAIFAIIVLLVKFPPIVLVILPLTALYSFVTYKTMQRNRLFFAENRILVNESAGVQTENISFVSDIRALGARISRGDIYRRYLNLHDSNLFKMFRFQHRRNFIASLIEIALFVLPIATFSYRAAHGLQNPSDVYVLAVYLGFISNFASRVGRVIQTTSKTNDSLGETLAILDQIDTVQDPKNPEVLTSLQKLTLQNVSFTYESKDAEALSNINLEIKCGQTIALVGRSGSGKSTLIKLLLRFYDPQVGQILFNSTPLTDYVQDDLRSRLGVVMQDVALFNDTIAGNIAIALPGASQLQIEQAAKLAYVHDFITSLPEGYQTLVGERGVKLSGGEKQRVSIARAVLRSPELVLLDEATSALDGESEKTVQAGLEELLKGRTAIIIAHRLSTITHADKIIVLDKGKIVQQGTYKQLKAQKGVFADLLKHQEL